MPPHVSSITTVFKPTEKVEFDTLKIELSKNGINVKLLPDGISKSELNETSFKTQFGRFTTTFDKDKKIKSFHIAPVEMSIQTVYRPEVTKTATSAYGSGTTMDDKKAGDTSLQFHESRHAWAFLNFIKTNTLPKFNGKIGMTEAEFDDSLKFFNAELKQYFDKMKENSERIVDCVGILKDTFDGSNTCSSLSISIP